MFLLIMQGVAHEMRFSLFHSHYGNKDKKPVDMSIQQLPCRGGVRSSVGFASFKPVLFTSVSISTASLRRPPRLYK